MKKLIAAFLALCLACSMAACAGGTTSESSTASTSSTSSESSVAEESVASEEPSSSDVSEASSEGSDTAEATVLSHEEYMAAELDTEVTIQAYVQAKQSYYAEQGTATVYLQDQDGAYFAYDMACTQEEYDAMTEGTCIQVTGFKSEWSGEIEIMDGQLDQIVEGDTFVAEPLDATELLGTDELEQHQNEKVSYRPDRGPQHRRQRQRGRFPVQLRRLRHPGRRRVLQRLLQRPDLQLCGGVLPVRQ